MSTIIPAPGLCIASADLYPGVPMGALDTQNATPAFIYPLGNTPAQPMALGSMAMPTAGLLRKMRIAVVGTSNLTIGNNLTRAYRNLTYSSLSVAYPPSSGATLPSDLQSVLYFSQGDTIDFRHEASSSTSGAAQFRILSIEYGAVDGSSLLAVSFGRQVISPGNTYYWALGGYKFSTSNALYNQLLVPFDCVLDHMMIVTGNTQPGTGHTNFSLGSLSVTVNPSDPGGTYSDLVNSVALSAGDIIVLSSSTTAATSAILSAASFRITPTSGIRGMLMATDSLGVGTYTSTRIWSLWGGTKNPATDTENEYVYICPCPGTIRNLNVFAAITGAVNPSSCQPICSWTLYKNGVPTAITAVCTRAHNEALTILKWCDETTACPPAVGTKHDVPVVEGDKLWIQVDPASGTTVLGQGRAVMEFERTV